MANFFPKWTNQLSWKAAVCLAAATVLLIAGITYYFTPKYTVVGYEPNQPIPFSHALHVRQLGLDCRFCHTFSTVAAQADLPSMQTCMSCHAQIKAKSPQLAAVAAAWNNGKGDGPPINWVRVHRLPDFVYFNHAAHINRGVSCYTCHGDIDEMPVVRQVQPQSMSWCLDCHKAPEKFLCPADQVFTGSSLSAADRLAIGTKLKREWQVNPPLSCGACHR